jgi:tetratricopeptide (TPR) repeat protein
MELTLHQALQKGIEAHKAGNVQEADRFYTAILKAQPKHPDANHNMGVLAVSVGKAEQSLPFFQAALELNKTVTQYWLSYIDALIKVGKLTDAKAAIDQAKRNGLKGNDVGSLERQLSGLETGSVVSNGSLEFREPPENQLRSLINLYTTGQHQKAKTRAIQLLKQYQNSINLYNMLGAANKSLGKLEEAIEAYKKALAIKPDYADAYYNMGNTLKQQGKLADAVDAYRKALFIKPDYTDAYYNMGVTFKRQNNLEDAVDAYRKALLIKPDHVDAYNNMGVALQEQGRLEEAIEAFTEALSLKPDFADAHYNMGYTLKEKGKLEDAIQSYEKALTFKPDFADAYYNLGNLLKEKGKLEEAIQAYQKAISIRPSFVEALYNLSTIKKFTPNDPHFVKVLELSKHRDLSKDDECYINFALAKMHEDVGELDKSFAYLSRGNYLRQKLLNYSINIDQTLFSCLKSSQAKISENNLVIGEENSERLPIFIFGMPRSGTTLVEQIISAHPEVFGAGELNYVAKFGKELCLDQTLINTASISDFRESYLSEVLKLQNEKHFVTDKMPQNFRFVPLICAAFPEAKLVHVKRNAAAVCWSNYKRYYATNGLGYCYDLKNLVAYYRLYEDLMNRWQSIYGDRIYNLNYENLTTQQVPETKNLLRHLGLDWNEACLSPHKNKRSIKTASLQQVRQKVYTGSSEEWRKYQTYLDGAFDSLAFL